MKNTDLRAKARAIFGPAFAEPMPNQPNGAKALQQRANARPIPTYKVGGVVKKPMPTPAASAASGNRMAREEADEMRFMDMMDKKKKSAMPSPAASAASGNRMAREEGAEMRKMKMAKGGKAGKYADGGMAEELLVEGRRPQTVDFDMNRMQGTTGGRMGPPAPSSGGGGVPAPAPAVRGSASQPANKIRFGKVPTAAGSVYGAEYQGKNFNVGAGLGRGLMGRQGAPMFGANANFQFAEGGKVKNKLVKKKDGGKVQTSSDTARKLASEMGGMKKGGKVKPVELDMKMLEEASRPRASLPNLESKVAEARNLNTVRAKETSDATKKQSFKEAFAEARRDQGANGVFTWRGNTYNTKMAGETSKAAPARAAAPAPTRAAAPAPARATPPADAPAPAARRNPPAAPASRPVAAPPPAATPTRGATTPPATPRAAPANKSGNANSSTGLGGAINRGVGAIQDQMSTQARNMAKNREENPDIFTRIANTLSERRKTKADSAAAKEAARRDYDAKAGRAGIGVMLERPPRSVNYAKGGKVKPKNGLAVMIAIGKPMKPAKKMNGGPMAERSADMESSKVTREMAMGGAPMGYAAGGAGKTRKGQAPIKKAQGGAAKVRKGMMTPEGDIINAMNKMRGK